MQNLINQITESQKVRSDLMKWKLVLVSGVGTAGLGLGSSVDFPNANLLLCLIPLIAIYVDSQCGNLSLRIKAIGEFISSIKPEGRAETLLKNYEKFIRKNPPGFRLEIIALHGSTIFLSTIIICYGYSYSKIPVNSVQENMVLFPILGSLTKSTLFYISGGLGIFLTLGVMKFINKRTNILRKLVKDIESNEDKRVKIIAQNPSEAEHYIFPDKSKRSLVHLKTSSIGLGTYQPGWQWSVHARPITGKPSENHIGYILSGHMIIQDSDGNEREIGPGDAFEVSPNHDAWVLGTEPCVALDFTHLQ